jgi:hypothetical protein
MEKGTDDKMPHDNIKTWKEKGRRKHVEASDLAAAVFSHRIAWFALHPAPWCGRVEEWKSGSVAIEILALFLGRDWPVPQPSEMAGCLICVLIRLPRRGANQTPSPPNFGPRLRSGG